MKLSDERMHIPTEPRHMEMHNEWCGNVPGSTFIMPVADLAQHMILVLCYLVQGGACIYDDVHGEQIPGLARFKDLVDIENPHPLAYMEQVSLAEVTVELSTSCYSGALMLQAMGLGGWMYDGINQFSVPGASGDPAVPGLGFRFDMVEGSPMPHVTGLQDVFEATVRPIFRQCETPSRMSSSESSVPAVRSTVRRADPTRKPLRFAAAPHRSTSGSSSA